MSLQIPVQQIALGKAVKKEALEEIIKVVPIKTAFNVDMIVNIKGGLTIGSPYFKKGTSRIPYKSVLALMLKKLGPANKEKTIALLLESIRESIEINSSSADIIKDLCPELTEAEQLLESVLIQNIEEIKVSPPVKAILSNEILASKINQIS